MRQMPAALIALCCAAVTTVAAQDLTFHTAGTFDAFQGPAMDVIALDPLSLGPVVPDAPYLGRSRNGVHTGSRQRQPHRAAHDRQGGA